MARRLLSGWLIALAALARSLALMFERAAAGRPEPTPDPVMAELAARYPGAPTHWLAHVAEYMARTAEAGEVPLSLTSDAIAWPEAVSASSQGQAPEPESASRSVADTPRHPSSRPVSPPPAGRAVGAVPSLEALQNRSSEVWRRPAAPGRRSRPVFVPLADPAPPRERSEDLTPSPQREPRPRLIVAVREPSEAHPDTPGSPTPTAETVKREVAPPAAAWPVSERPPAVRAEPETPPGTIDATPKAHATPPIRPIVAPSSTATAFEPPVDETPRPAIHLGTQRPVAIDAPRVERPTPSRTRRVRRAIFQVIAGLRAKPRVERHLSWTKPTLQLVSETPPRQSPQRPGSLPLRAVFPTIADPVVPSHRTTPTTRSAPKPGPRAAPRRPRLVWSQAPSEVASRQAFPPSIDDRWPAFPPKTFSPPPLAELPLPRLEQLAREQEEGRWSV